MSGGDSEEGRLTGPALLFLTGRELADGARVAVQAALHADETEATSSVLGWWCIGLVVVTAYAIQHLNEP